MQITTDHAWDWNLALEVQTGNAVFTSRYLWPHEGYCEIQTTIYLNLNKLGLWEEGQGQVEEDEEKYESCYKIKPTAIIHTPTL